MSNYCLRNAVTLGTGLTALFLLVHCTVQDRDYAELNIGNAGPVGDAGHAGRDGTGGDGSGAGNGGAGGNGGAAGPDDPDAGLPDDGQDSGASGFGGGGSGATGGSGGVGGTGGAGGTGGTGGVGGTGGSSGSGGSGECGPVGVCVPVVPSGWTGPTVVSNAGGVTSCPGTYATPLGNVNAGLNAPAANCGCGCFVSSVDCFISSGNTGARIEPIAECDSPPTNDDCLSAQLSTSCTPNGTQTITPSTWATTRLTCGGGASNDSCTGGSCFPSASAFGPICISQNADVACPSAFPNRSLFFRGVADTRSCTACGCFTQGHSCVIDLNVCSLGDYQITLSTDLGNEECLNSSDGDGLTLLSTSTPGGSCTTTGGAAQGSAVPSNPVTFCCL